MTGRRGLLVAVTACALAGALVVFASGRVWGSARLTAATGAVVRASVTGRDVSSALPAFGIAILVLAVALVAGRSWLRRGVGLLVVVLGGAVVAVATTSDDEVAASLGRAAFAVRDAPAGVPTSGWALLCAAAGALAVAAGAMTFVVGGRWPGLGARYDAPTAPGQAEQLPSAAVTEPTVAWDALDRGEDPTA